MDEFNVTLDQSASDFFPSFFFFPSSLLQPRACTHFPGKQCMRRSVSQLCLLFHFLLSSELFSRVSTSARDPRILILASTCSPPQQELRRCFDNSLRDSDMIVDLTEDSPQKNPSSAGAAVGNLRGGCGRGSDSGEDFAPRHEKERVTLEGRKPPKRTLAYTGSASSPDANEKRLKGAPQRPFMDDDKKWVLVDGDDCKDEFAEDSKWRAIVGGQRSWEDKDFPAAKESIDGPPEADKAMATGASEQSCRCGQIAKKAVVGKETPNKGREYFHCAMRRCGFFSWADQKRSSWKHYDWKRFPSYVIVSDFGFSAEVK